MRNAVQTLIWQLCILVLFPSLSWAFSGSRTLLAQSGLSAQTRSYTVEIAIVVILIGAALFVICRSSRRS